VDCPAVFDFMTTPSDSLDQNCWLVAHTRDSVTSSFFFKFKKPRWRRQRRCACPILPSSPTPPPYRHHGPHPYSELSIYPSILHSLSLYSPPFSSKSFISSCIHQSKQKRAMGEVSALNINRRYTVLTSCIFLLAECLYALLSPMAAIALLSTILERVCHLIPCNAS